MKNKFIISIVIIFLILVGSFLYFYFQSPVLKLKDDLSAEINTDRKIYEYISGVE